MHRRRRNGSRSCPGREAEGHYQVVRTAARENAMEPGFNSVLLTNIEGGKWVNVVIAWKFHCLYGLPLQVYVFGR